MGPPRAGLGRRARVTRGCRCPPAASAVFHDSPRILLAAVKFFLGQDEPGAGGGGSDDEGDGGGEEEARAVNPTRAEVYNASKKVRAAGPAGSGGGVPAALADPAHGRRTCLANSCPIQGPVGRRDGSTCRGAALRHRQGDGRGWRLLPCMHAMTCTVTGE